MEERLFAAVLETSGYIVGSSNAPSGLHRYTAGEGWRHLGWQNVRCFGIALHPDERTIFLACGNGVFRSADGGETWRVTTGWEITEVLDIAIDPADERQVWIATVHGIWRSPDLGDTWTEVNPRTTHLFCQTLAADPSRPHRWFAGTETGLLLTEDDGATWQAVGPHDAAIRTLCPCPTDSQTWLAGTEDRGLMHSVDGGHTWRTMRPGGHDTFYAAALHPTDPTIMAAAGLHTGVCTSLDAGATWRCVTDGLPTDTFHALTFAPSGRIVAGAVNEGVFASTDGGLTWAFAGLPEATLYELVYA